jgi:hydroxypyruvate reductase
MRFENLRRRGPLGEAAAALVTRVLESVDPFRLLREQVRREENRLWIQGDIYDLGRYERVFVVGGGKASGRMAEAVEEILGETLTAGIVVVKDGHAVPTRKVRLVEASHPLPDERGGEGTREILALVEGATSRDLVLCLLSGGASALLELPPPGVSLEDLRRLNGLLLRSGATIQEINALRKHLSRIKGGQLAHRVSPATLITLVLSDVVGDPLDVIGSGPTVPDTATFQDAMRVIERYDLLEETPPSILRYLEEGGKGKVPETPKEGEPFFSRGRVYILGNNATAVRAAEEQARKLGFRSLLLTTYLEGEAREVGRVLAAVAREVRTTGNPVEPPACLLAGGETTVTLRGEGMGGRNQELALSAALSLAALPGILLLSFGTDGGDGPTPAAGAFVDGETVRQGEERGLSAGEHLERNDSYPFFKALDSLIITGPTYTNVNDLVLILVSGKRRGSESAQP